jgi:membrane-bound lytic murein transglycosylase D
MHPIIPAIGANPDVRRLSDHPSEQRSAPLMGNFGLTLALNRAYHRLNFALNNKDPGPRSQMKLARRIGLPMLLLASVFGCTTVAPPQKPAEEPISTTSAIPQPADLPPVLEPAAEVTAAEADDPIAEIVKVTPYTEDDLWTRIRSGFRLPNLDSALVKAHVRWYATRPDYVQRMTERSGRYLFYIVQEVERRGMPTEIALLPMIESGYNPTAMSRSRASGMWQFIPSTGKHFGLDQSWWYDGRRDVLAGTHAALDYLQKLYGMFGSWDLALAAYNAGEGTVSRAIAANAAKGRPTDYQSLRLSNETQHYVPKLQAIKNIVLDPAAYGLALQEVPNKPYFAIVEIRKHIDVALAARFADLSLEEFVALNPAYNTPLISPRDSERLLLPIDNAEVFRLNMQHYGNRQLHSWQAYQAKSGERVDKIAAKFGITPAHLRSLNKVQEKHGKLRLAQLLLVPLKQDALPQQITTLASNKHALKEKADAAALLSSHVADKAVPDAYVVQKGDTLFGIAKRFGTTIDELQARNHLDGSAVKIGDTLTLVDLPASETHTAVVDPAGVAPPPVAVAPVEVVDEPKPVIAASQPAAQPVAVAVAIPAKPVPTRTSFYVIRPGDTLYGIAKLFKVAVVDVMRWNNLNEVSKLVPGHRVRIVLATN